MSKDQIPTPHINAKYGDFADTVLLPGDPLRAKLVAETFLEDAKQVTGVRGALGFTGLYKGERVSVMGTGMGMPSIGIYSYELFNFYDVKNLVRIGSAGSISDRVHVMDIVLGQGACTNSSFVNTFKLPGTFAPIADWDLLETTARTAKEIGINTVVGNILSSDVFYGDDPSDSDRWRKMGVLCIEMEAAALYMNAARCGKKALTILTISDEIYTGKALSAEDRQNSFKDMMKLALESAIRF